MSSTEKIPSDKTTAAEKIVLRSSDGEEFEVEASVAERSVTIRNMIEDGWVEGGVPLPNVRSAALSTVLEYLNKKHGVGAAGDDFRKFEEAFLEGMGKEELSDVIMAANYLDSQELLGAACQCLTDRIKDIPVEEVREYFGIAGDFTPEEEAELSEENDWAFK